MAVWAGVAVLLLIGAAIAWLYANPPLWNSGGSYAPNRSPQAFVLNLTNEGRWPITLTGVTNEEGHIWEFAAVATTDRTLASSVALAELTDPGRENIYVLTGPVYGWVMEPDRDGTARTQYGLRLQFHGTSKPKGVRIHYRYLGLPFALAVEEYWLK